METLLICGGMLYLYSCCSFKVNRLEENDELKISIRFNPFYPFECLIKSLPPIPNRRYKEESQIKNNQPRFEGFQQRTNINVEENNNNETTTS